MMRRSFNLAALLHVLALLLLPASALAQDFCSIKDNVIVRSNVYLICDSSDGELRMLLQGGADAQSRLEELSRELRIPEDTLRKVLRDAASDASSPEAIRSAAKRAVLEELRADQAIPQLKFAYRDKRGRYRTVGRDGRIFVLRKETKFRISFF